MKIQPQNQRILIIPIDGTIAEVVIKNAGKIIEVPDNVKPHYARVLAVAPDCKFAKVGDKVITQPNPNVCIVDFHLGYGLIHETNILATFEEEPKLEVVEKN